MIECIYSYGDRHIHIYYHFEGCPSKYWFTESLHFEISQWKWIPDYIKNDFPCIPQRIPCGVLINSDKKVRSLCIVFPIISSINPVITGAGISNVRAESLDST